MFLVDGKVFYAETQVEAVKQKKYLHISLIYLYLVCVLCQFLFIEILN
jgi:hypothetical protein